MRLLLIIFVFLSYLSIFYSFKSFTNPFRKNSLIKTTISNDILSTTNPPNSITDIEEGFIKFFDDSPLEVNEPKVLKYISNKPFPSYLNNGIYIKNGPALFSDMTNTTESRKYTHLFDGLAKLTKYEFVNNNQIQFTTKFLHSKMYNTTKSHNKIYPTLSIGPMIPKLTNIELIKALLKDDDYDNTCVNIVKLGDKWYGLTDAPVLMEFDIHTLTTIKQVKFPNKIENSISKKILFSTAHPIYNKNNQCLYNYYLEVNILPNIPTIHIPFLTPTTPPTSTTNNNKNNNKSHKAHIIKIYPNLTREIIGTINIQTTDDNTFPYIHDISITNNYIILIEYPIGLTMNNLISKKGFISNIKWLPTHTHTNIKTKIHIFSLYPSSLDRTRTTDPTSTTTPNAHMPSNDVPIPPLATYETDPIFAYHHVNAYEEECTTTTTTTTTTTNTNTNTNTTIKQIVVDITGYKNADIANHKHGFLYIPNMLDSSLRSQQISDGECIRYRMPAPTSNSAGHTTTSTPTVTYTPSSTTSASNTSTTTSSNSISERHVRKEQQQHASPPPSPSPHIYIKPTLLSFKDSNGDSYTSEMVRVDDNKKGTYCRYSYGMTGFSGKGQNYDPSNSSDTRGGYLQWALVKRDHKVAEKASGASVPTLLGSVRGTVRSSLGQSEVASEYTSSAFLWREDECYPTEPVFVKDPDCEAEDAGVYYCNNVLYT